MSDTVTTILARGAATAAAEVSPLLMWMPAGTQTIHARNGKGEDVTVQVQVDRSTAAAAQQALGRHLAASAQRPFFDFDHAGEKASAWPLEFSWQDQPAAGVYARVEWSDAGKAAILGKEYRAFSPAFLIDKSNPAKVIGAPLNMGGLVNDPAFAAIQPLFASSGSSGGANEETILATGGSSGGANENAILATGGSGAGEHNVMNENNTGGSAAAGTATAAATAITATSGASSQVVTAAGAAPQADIAALQAENVRLANALKAARKTEAENLVRAAVARGAIAPQATQIQARWVDSIVADAANAELLAGLAGNDAVGTRITASGVSVQADEIGTVLRAYAAEKNPGNRAAIFAKSIKPVFNKDNEVLIQAANTLGTLVGDLVVQRSLTFLKFEFPVLSRITTDFSAESASYNQTIRTRIRSALTATDFNTSSGYASSDVTDTDVTVVLNNHKAVQITYGANDLASTRRLLFGEQEEPVHYAIGKALVDALYALLTTANFTNSTKASVAATSRGTLVEIAKQLTLRGVRQSNRTLLANTPVFAQLQNDATLIQLATFQDRSLIEQYKLPMIANLQPIEAPNLPSTNNLTGVAFTPDALLMAVRLPNDYTQVFPGATGGGVTSVVTNPDTGVSVMLTQFIDHKLGAAYMRVAFMFGVAVGQAASGQLLVTA